MTLPGAPPPRGAPPLPPSLHTAAQAGITSPHAGNDLDYIRTAIHALQLYAEGETDDQELATVHKCILALQQILAEDAKNNDAATGITPALKAVRRQTQRGY